MCVVRFAYYLHLVYNIVTVKGYRISETSTVASTRKEILMNEEMNLSEMFKEVTEENQTRKILAIIENCKDLNEAIEKVKALLTK